MKTKPTDRIPDELEESTIFRRGNHAGFLQVFDGTFSSELAGKRHPKQRPNRPNRPTLLNSYT